MTPRKLTHSLARLAVLATGIGVSLAAVVGLSVVGYHPTLHQQRLQAIEALGHVYQATVVCPIAEPCEIRIGG